MGSYRIFLDLSADLDLEFAKENNIGFIPMIYSIDEKEYISTDFLNDEKLKEFYDKMLNDSVTKTSQITPFQYIEYLDQFAKKGENILYFTLSSGLSNTYNSALLAKEELCDKYKDFKFEVVDSLAATGGIGVLCHIAIENQKKGMTIEENADVMRNITKNIKHWFYVEDLKYLKRGGRVTASKAFIANALNIKPVMIVNKEGKLEAVGKKLGVKRCQQWIVEKFIESFDNSSNIVYICHALSYDAVNFLKKKLLEFNPNLEIHVTTICPVIGCHSGPGTVTVCHIGK